MANPPTYPSDGRITSLQNYSSIFTGGELFPIVAPGNATAGINYNVTANQVAAGLFGSPAAGYELTGISGTTPAFIFPPGGVSVTAYGAKVDGVTDDSAAVQSAINSLTNGGTVFFPPGTCIVHGLSVPAAVLLKGSGGDFGGSVLTSNNVDTTILTMTGNSPGLVDLLVQGGGLNSVNPGVVMGTTTEATIRFSRILGGAYAVEFSNATDFFVIGSDIAQSYGTANAYLMNSNGFIVRSKLDQAWQKQAPSVGTQFTSWAATTAFATSAVAALNGYYIQALSGGTSAGVAPTLANYGSTFVDGSITWRLRAPQTHYGLQIDTGCANVEAIQSEFSGANTAGVALTNSLSGNTPQQLQLIGCYFGNPIQNGVLLSSGELAIISGCYFNTSVSTTSAHIAVTGTWGNDLAINNNVLWSGITGISLGTGSFATITGNDVSNMSAAAVSIGAGVSHFTITGNQLGGSSGIGPNGIAVQIATGASDYFNIVGNNINGATTGIVNNGTGTHQFVGGNEAPVQNLAGGSNPGVSLFGTTSVLATSVPINSTTAFATGPSVTLDTAANWLLSGNVTVVNNTSATQTFKAIITDSVNVYASGAQNVVGGVGAAGVISLSGFSGAAGLAGTTVSLEVSASLGTGTIATSVSGQSKDSSITGVRIG